MYPYIPERSTRLYHENYPDRYVSIYTWEVDQVQLFQTKQGHWEAGQLVVVQVDLPGDRERVQLSEDFDGQRNITWDSLAVAATLEWTG